MTQRAVDVTSFIVGVGLSCAVLWMQVWSAGQSAVSLPLTVSLVAVAGALAVLANRQASIVARFVANPLVVLPWILFVVPKYAAAGGYGRNVAAPEDRIALFVLVGAITLVLAIVLTPRNRNEDQERAVAQ